MKSKIIHTLCALLCCWGIQGAQAQTTISNIRTERLPMNDGTIKPAFESIAQNTETPDWFKNAKFGIFAHWGPQCQPGSGDWYARGMYIENGWQGKFHRQKYGHPSKFGFKDVIHEWKADKWNPDELVALYKKMGARYLVSLANHHDNFDLFDSKYQPWNSVNMGPKRDIMKDWKAAAEKHGLHWGTSVHAAHAWLFYETSQGADKDGEFAGVPYDGNITKADGKGLWWEGYDPQDLYAQNHPRSKGFDWDWGKDDTPPSTKFENNVYNRTIQIIDDYQPEILYFDDTVLPFYPISDAGLSIAAYYHNANAAQHDGKSQGVITGKVLNEEQRNALVWDVERGTPSGITSPHWQTDTCIGSWHYDTGVYERGAYKNATTIVRTLIDIVSKGGNLLLSVPIRGDGTIDEKELAIANGIAHWMQSNSEGIYDTHYWKVYGEGPQTKENNAIQRQGFNEGKGKAATAKDIRYTQKGNTIYAFLLGVPKSNTILKAFAGEKIASITLLGSNEGVNYYTDTDGTLILLPPTKAPFTEALTYKITLATK